MATTQIVISHYHEERALALAWKELLSRTSNGQIEAWFSSDEQPDGGQPAGVSWEDEVYRRLKEAKYVLAILTPNSLNRPWIWWECGAATGLERTGKLVPIVYSMPVEQLPRPASRYGAIVGDDRRQVATLCQRVLREVGLAPPELQFWDPLLNAFDQSVEIALTAPKPLPEAARLGAPRTSGSGVLVDHSHRQKEWNYDSDSPSVIEVDDLRDRLRGSRAGSIELLPIENPAQLNLRALESWSGLVFAMPWTSKLEDDGRDAIVEWVRRGGRLLLLGYELGDRHHGGNLNELAYRFGLHFESTIVAPASWPLESGRPYGQLVTYSVVNAHPVLDQLTEVTLINAQTVSGEPGTRRILGVGANRVVQPVNPPERVRYNRDGKWQLIPPEALEVLDPSATHAVLVQAPRDLTAKGSVLALGSWKFAPGANSDSFLRNLMHWLVDRT